MWFQSHNIVNCVDALKKNKQSPYKNSLEKSVHADRFSWCFLIKSTCFPIDVLSGRKLLGAPKSLFWCLCPVCCFQTQGRCPRAKGYAVQNIAGPSPISIRCTSTRKHVDRMRLNLASEADHSVSLKQELVGSAGS